VSAGDHQLPEMPCQELVERVTDYLEGALNADDRARLEAHLAECDGCEQHLAQLGRTLALTGETPAEDVAPSLRAELLASFAAWRDERL
jgi:anti-sigma factor RsiW